jgi:hypothetical protein
MFGSPSVTTCLLCRLLSSTLEPHYMVEIAIPWLDKILYVRFCLSLIKNHRPYHADLHHHATVGHYCYTLLICPSLITLWSFIIPSSLKTMVNFTHLIHLIICASFGPSRGTPSCHFPLGGLIKSITSLVNPSLLFLGPCTSSPKRDYS